MPWGFFYSLTFGTARDKELIDNLNFPLPLESQSNLVDIFQRFKPGILHRSLALTYFGFALVSFFWFFFSLAKGKQELRGIGQTSPATQWGGFQIRQTWRTSYGREGNRTHHPGKRTRKSLLVFQTAAGSQEWLCEAQRTAAGRHWSVGERPSLVHSCQSCLSPAMSPALLSLHRTWGLQGGCRTNGLIVETWKLLEVWSEQEPAWGPRC